jgi:hypothetical protein
MFDTNTLSVQRLGGKSRRARASEWINQAFIRELMDKPSNMLQPTRARMRYFATSSTKMFAVTLSCVSVETFVCSA